MDAPEAVFKAKFHTLSVVAFSESFVGHRACRTGMTSSATGLALSANGMSIDFKQKDLSKTLFKKEANGVVINYEVTNISNRTLNITNNALYIFT